MDDAINKVADLNNLAGTDPPYTPAGYLEQLWEQCPSVIDSLPFFQTDEKRSAASAYLWSAEQWLIDAKKVYPEITQQSPDMAQELAANIVRIEKNVAYLKGLGYTATLDGASAAVVALARKIRNNTPSGGTLKLGAAVVVGLILLAVYFRFR